MTEYKKFIREVTAALPYISIKGMHKQYSQFMNKVTIGFEVEVSGGTAFENSNTVDLEETRRAFENDFAFTKYDFIKNMSAEEIQTNFDVEPKYGFAGSKFEEAIKEYLIQQEAIGTLKKYSIVNDKDVIKVKMEEQIILYNKFFADNEIDKVQYDTQKFFNTYYLDSLKDNYVKFANGKESEQSKSFYEFERYVSLIKAEFIKLKNVINLSASRMQWAVLTDTGGLAVISLNNYTEAGLLSPYINFNEKEFEEAYTFEYKNEKARQWPEFLADVQSGLDEENSDVIDKIYELVLTKVDPDAEFSQGYHSDNVELIKGKKTIVEGDSSISPAGAEIVSKVFTGLQPAFEWLDDIFDMIEEEGLETNKTTGFHVNIGTFNSIVPEFDKARTALPHLDVVKLALLLGDHYLLQQFDRLGNTYTKSISSNLRNLSMNFYFKEDFAKGFSFLSDLNKTFIKSQTGDNNSRYRTMNMQNFRNKRYLEFRIAGGANYHKDREKIKRLIYRYVQLCAVACDPEAYLKEYMTELYKLFNVKSKTVDPLVDRQPRPKNVQQALYYLRLWDSTHNLSRASLINNIAKKETTKVILEDDFIDSEIESVLDIVAALNTDEYKYVNLNVLYSIRLLLLNCVNHKENPKQFLSDFLKERIGLVANLMAPKLYKNKPEWVRYFFTGSISTQTQQELKAMSTMEANMKSKREKNLKEGNDTQDKEFDAFYKTIKADPAIKKAVIPERWEWDIFADCYFTARMAGQSDKSAQRFAKAMFWDYVNNGRKDGITDVQLKALYKKYTGKSDLNFEKRSKAFAKLKQKEDNSEKYINWEEWEKSMEASEESRPYTNKGKKTKAIYYSNRSTPQTCKPGQTVKAKKGYGKRTKIRNITDEELKLVKKGGWIRTREDGKAHNDPKSKTSKYRPKLAKKQLAARKRRMAASEGSSIFKDFIKEHMDK